MIKKVRLRNGGQLLLKSIAEANSISIGIYSLVGLHQEPENCNGIAHFLEHMSFKGTKKRTAKQITEGVDHIGAHLNAHTTKEYTCYYMTVLPHSIKKAVDILFDLFVNSTLALSDIEMEKQVVLEEIHMYEDTPDEHIHDCFSSTIWGKNQLGQSILGAADSLKHINRKVLREFKRHYLNPKNLIISVAGKIEDEKGFIKMINGLCQFSEKTKPFSEYREKPKSSALVSFRHKETEQMHFCLGCQGVSFDHKDHYKVTMLATILGGSMSSRLFQKIREKRGWAYSVYAYASFYKDSGLFTIYGGVNKDKFLDSLKIVVREFDYLKQKPISAKELRKVKEQLKGNLILSLERSSSWMSWMARSMMYFNRVVSVEEIIDEIESVTQDDIQRLASKLFQNQRLALSAIGPLEKNILELDSGRIQTFLEQNKLLLK